MAGGRTSGVELRWPGKVDADGRRAAIPSPGHALRTDARYPAASPERGEGRLILGDNLAVMDALLESHAGSIDLIYIDPPFATGGAFSAMIPAGEGDGQVRAPAYSDRWEGGLGGFLAFLDPRLRLCERLLAPHGSLYVHLDATVAHPVKLMLDEILGPTSFQREIIWRIGWISGFKSRARNWIRNHDTILFYVKDPGRFTFNKAYLEYPPGYRRRDGSPPRGRGIPLDDVWNAGPADLQLRGADSLDSIQIKSFSREKTGWATQKNESLCRRIIAASSNPGDLVADFFCGSGSTLAAAAELGRRFLGCDRAHLAVHLARRRLRARGVGLEVQRAVAPPAGARRRTDGDARVVLVDHAVDAAFVAAEARAAAGDGRARLDVIAAAWAFAAADAPREVEGVAVHLAHARGDEAPIERPRAVLAWESVEPWVVELTLRDYRFQAPERLPGELLGAPSGLDLVDCWAIAWRDPAAEDRAGEGDRAVFTPALERHRDPRTRALPLAARLEVPAPRVAAIVQIVDVFGLETRWPFTLTFAGDGALESAVAGVEAAIG